MIDYEQLLRDILDRGPSSETLGLVLEELKRLGRGRKVIQECIRALRNHPDDLSLRLILAEAYLEEGLVAHAEAETETAVSLMDRYASTYWLQTEIYRSQKRNEEALRSLKTYVALRPWDERALDLLREMEIVKAAPAPEVVQVQEEPSEAVADEEAEAPALKGIEPLETGAEKSAFGFDGEVLSEIATPTLAEVYVNQGQVTEAVRIYESVIAQYPEDEASVMRIQELRDMLKVEPPPSEQTAPRAEPSKKKTIAILESWLANIRKMSGDRIST